MFYNVSCNYDKQEAKELHAEDALANYGIKQPGTRINKRTWMCLKPMVRGVDDLSKVKKL